MKVSRFLAEREWATSAVRIRRFGARIAFQRAQLPDRDGSVISARGRLSAAQEAQAFSSLVRKAQRPEVGENLRIEEEIERAAEEVSTLTCPIRCAASQRRTEKLWPMSRISILSDASAQEAVTRCIRPEDRCRSANVVVRTFMTLSFSSSGRLSSGARFGLKDAVSSRGSLWSFLEVFWGSSGRGGGF